jgi:hypothetical protein
MYMLEYQYFIFLYIIINIKQWGIVLIITS